MIALPKALFGPVVPYESETLLSIIARSADLNVHPKICAFLRLAGINTLRPAFLPFTKIEHAEALSSHLGLPVHVVIARMHPASTNPGCIDWYGTPIPRSFVEAETYRFSPTSLKKGGYQRAGWMLRPFTFCQDSMELLTSTCTHCGWKQIWKYCSPMDICEKCRAPLAQFQSEAVPTDLQLEAKIAATLASPYELERRSMTSSFPKPFSEWEAGEVLSAVVELGAVLNEGRCHNLVHKVKNGDFSDFSVQHLVVGVRFLQAWPDSLAELVTTQVSSKTSCDLTKCLGPLSRYFRGPPTTSKLRRIICSDTQEILKRVGHPARGSRNLRAKWITPLGTINQKAATLKYHIDNRTLRLLETNPDAAVKAACARGHCLYDEAALANSIAILRDGLTTIRCSKRLDVPECFLEALLNRDHIALVADVDAVTMARQRMFEGNSVRALLSKLRPDPSSSANGLPLSQMLRHRFHPDDWADAVDGILDGNLKLTIGGSPTIGGLNVEPTSARSFLMRLPVRPAPNDVWVSVDAAGLLLGLCEMAVRSVMKEGFLPFRRNGKGRIEALLSDIESFDERYFVGSEARAEFGFDSRTLARMMHYAGYSPVPRVRNTRIWNRRDVVSLMVKEHFAHELVAGS